MKRLFSVSLAMVLILAFMTACDQGEKAADSGAESVAGAEPVKSEIAFTFAERDLIPEGMAYDPVSDSFFMGSIRKRKILRIFPDGTVTEFVPTAGGGIYGVLGVRVDPERRVLWANAHMDTSTEGYNPDEQAKTGIFKYSLEDGSLIKAYTVDKTDKNHLFNDVAIAQDGTAYITSYSYGTIYKVDSATDELTEWLDMPEGAWTNGIDITPDNKYLFVVASNRVARIDIATGEILEMPEPEGEQAGYGDGLYVYKDGLVAVSAIEKDGRGYYRIVRMHLNENLDAITKIDILDEAHPLWDFPTTGAIVDGWFYYIATAQFASLDEAGNIAPWEELSDNYILKIKLD